MMNSENPGAEKTAKTNFQSISQKVLTKLFDISQDLIQTVRKATIRNPKSVLFNISKFKNDNLLTRQAQERIYENGLRSINALDVAKIKKSDTLFILGSGASVNDLCDSDWEKIAACTSIGFNYWMAHPFVPDLYFTEPPNNLNTWKDFLTLFEARKDDYSQTPFIINYKEWQSLMQDYPLEDIPEELLQNLYCYAPYFLRLNKPWMVRLVLLSWGRKKFERNPYDWLILQRGTLGMLIMFGYFAGFQNIVLVGVDLSNTNYFFEDPKKDFVFRPSKVQTGNIHRTVDPTLDINRISITIDKYIYLLNDIILKPRGISLFVASEKSRLYPRIGKYEFSI